MRSKGHITQNPPKLWHDGYAEEHGRAGVAAARFEIKSPRHGRRIAMVEERLEHRSGRTASSTRDQVGRWVWEKDEVVAGKNGTQQMSMMGLRSCAMGRQSHD